MDLMSIAFAIIALVLGIIGGVWLKNLFDKNQIAGAKENAEAILDDAIQQAQVIKREALFEAKEENLKYRNETEAELRERRSEVSRSEDRLHQREETLDQKTLLLEEKEVILAKDLKEYRAQELALEKRTQEIERLIQEQQDELTRVAKMSREEAQEIIRRETAEELSHEIAVMIRESEQQAKETADKNAKDIILQAMQRGATDVVTENSITVVQLPNDDMKGRIIGREGRNIKTLESLTGIDLIIDDTPEAVVLSGFDPIRREIARMTLERLIQDGRIHPGRIEEMVERSKKQLEERIREVGEEATFELGLHTLHPDLVKIIGRLAYRTSYGQNALQHSVEVAKLSGAMAVQLGEDPILAKRAGLMHDIGKALDQEIEGSHVEIGTELAMRYKEPEVVVNSIASHHGDTEATSVIAVIVAIADTLSAARPGARSESLENYIKRLEQLEEISSRHDGVDHSYAIQAGREIRVMVKPDHIDDAQAYVLARNIKKQIENEMNYPGNIKVTVIRETRAIEYAK